MRRIASVGVGSRAQRSAISCAVVVGLALGAAACGDDGNDRAGDDTSSGTGAVEPTDAPEDPVEEAQQRVSEAEDGVTQAQEDLTAAHGEFCSAAEGYVETLDRYGRLFTDRAATVGDINTLGADLMEPGEEVESAAVGVSEAKDALADAQQELLDAQAALAAAIATASSVPESTATPAAVTTTTLVPEATITRVRQAQDDLDRIGRRINDDTPLIEAAADYNAAALALEIAWMQLLDQSGCLSDEQRSSALEQVTAFTTALQTDLVAAGYDPGPIDGVYGPSTVAAVEQLQTDAGLPVTGLVDERTARALQEMVGDEEARTTIILQTILSLTGFWEEPIDGVWSDELTEALKAFQTELGVEPTGEVDVATIAAFQQALTDLEAVLTSTTTTTVATTPPETTPPATTPSTDTGTTTG